MAQSMTANGARVCLAVLAATVVCQCSPMVSARIVNFVTVNL